MGSLPGKGLQSIIAVLAGWGTAVQLVVLAILMLGSIVCWAIIVHKARLLRKVQRDNIRFLHAFHAGEDLAFLTAAARRFTASPLTRLFRTAQQQLEGMGGGQRPLGDGDAATAPGPTRERLRQILRLMQAEEVAHLEQGLPFLATTASAAPFIGLFGTVWGIMQAFHAIGQGGGASLVVVGPGISEALVATAAGLAAAIPAVVAYNHYLNRIRRLEGVFESFAEDLIMRGESRPQNDIPRMSGRFPLQQR